MAPRNHAACVASYCDAILSGEIIAGRYVELAVRRYLDDLEHAHERGFGSFFSSSDSTGGSAEAVDEAVNEAEIVLRVGVSLLSGLQCRFGFMTLSSLYRC